ncbi:MAG: hypothetical protein M0011_02360 [Elusimicrobia bacterium]|nr:hypothetical protein [Elusimicrobiota bacterium]
MNKKIISSLGIAAMMAVLVGCNEINFGGMLDLTSPVTFANQNRAIVTINPGQFQTKAVIGKSGNNKEITLEIKNADQPTKVKISFDKNINIGETFDLTPAQIGQNFGLKGTMKTVVTNSADQSGWESCTYQRPETICRALKSNETAASKTLEAGLGQDEIGSRQAPSVPNPVAVHTPDFQGQPPHVPNCYTQWVTQWGHQNVTFHFQTTTRDLAAGFVQGDQTLGSYTGKSVETEKIYTYQGQCY